MARRILDTSHPSKEQSKKVSVVAGPKSIIEGEVDFSNKSIPDKHIWFEAHKSDKLNILPSYYHHTSFLTHEGVPRRIKCVACNICIPEHSKSHLTLGCKPTFRIYPQKLSEVETEHHFVEKLGVDFSCHKCQKKFPKNKAVPVCSWCHQVYHIDCLSTDVREASCKLGPHSRLILPSSWVVKLEKTPLSMSLSLPVSRAKQTHKQLGHVSSCSNDKSTPLSLDPGPQSQANFSIIPQVLGASNVYPLLVFVHPKSGGGQGLTILKEFMWLLNPRQVFDLTKVKPDYALQLFQGTNVRVLCCGGDGTAGWVMSAMETLQLIRKPPIAMLPLGTGNDLSRVSGWGASYSDDEPLTQILFQIEAASVRALDRWNVEVTPNTTDVPRDASANDDVPIQVMSNYFSMGMDAHAALEFHQFRERNRDKSQSRLKNKFIYLKTGSIDFLKRTYLSMCDHIELVCDGTDYTTHIRNNNYAALVFLNISSYGAGTDPWGTPNLKKSTFVLQNQHDGMLEVIGLKQSQISLLFVGGHGDRIVQAREIRITSTVTLPIQVDGEPCLLNPSSIFISFKCSANLLINSIQKKDKDRFQEIRSKEICPLMLVLNVVTFEDYNDYNMDITQLRKTAVHQGYIDCNLPDNLASLRDQVQRILQSHLTPAPSQWCYLNVSSGERNTFIRIHPDQEELVKVQDLPSDAVYVLKLECMRSASGTLSLISGIDIEPAPEHQQVTSSDSRESPLVIRVSNRAGNTVNSIDNKDNKIQSITKDEVKSSEEKNKSELSQLNKGELEELLFNACSEGNLEKVQEIHTFDVNLYCVDTLNRTPLHITSSKGHRQVAQYLIDNYPLIAIDIQDNILKETALHIAASMGNRSICKMLIKAHSSLILHDSKDRTPYQRSKLSSDFSLETYLWKHEQHQRNKLEFSI
ncbi:Diacylglycerol kinase zeta isoform X4 [Oopsacas minuta]|uniref:Diacylglycerol kinase n=1 Tax=Oopsacas minuta TaxID=111878 RepID=A0AAV7KBS0_9METZ|nr:Diacylglycerol kinase zeta isoform X4 [Oopsacas minuta]